MLSMCILLIRLLLRRGYNEECESCTFHVGGNDSNGIGDARPGGVSWWSNMITADGVTCSSVEVISQNGEKSGTHTGNRNLGHHNAPCISWWMSLAPWKIPRGCSFMLKYSTC